MKVLLYTDSLKLLDKSGLGKAIKHQIRALEDNKVDYTLDPKEHWDIVHLNFYGPKSYLLAKKAKKVGKKIVYHAHSTEEDFRNSFILSNQIAPLFKWWICKCYRLGDHIITPTPYSKRLLEGYGLKNISAISNGIDTNFFRKDEKLATEFRDKYNYAKDDKVIVGIGLYLERKGILDFIELAKRMPNYKFIWFGYLDLKLVPLKIRKAVQTKLDNLTFAGHVSKEVIKSALSGCDLYLFPTLEETEGIPILEAAACRAKILVRNIPVFEDWTEDGVNVYKANNIDEFEDKINKIINNELPDLTEEAYEIAISKDCKKVGKELIEIYNDILNNS